jgi:hypothetical protein
MAISDLFGRNISINKEIRERYDSILSGFIFKDRDLKYIFMICFALGYKSKNRKSFEKPVGLLNVNSFSNDDLWTMISVAVKETGNLQIISKGAEIKKIASEYAYGGLDELDQLIADYGSGDALELALEKIARESLENN